MTKFKYPDSLIEGAFKDINRSDRELLESHYLDFLSEEQAEVALHLNGPLMVIAGPGSGKTETMVRRTSILLDFHNIDPENIALTTFTEKAAASLLTKIKSQVKSPEVIEKLTIGTIHGFCLSLLEEYGVKYGLFKRSIRVLDEHRLSLFVYNKYEEIGLKEFMGSRIKKNNLQAVMKFYSDFQEKGVKLNDFKDYIDTTEDVNEALAVAFQTFPKYKELLEENNAVDFSAILTRTMDLLKLPDALDEIQERFKYLIIDEYQDTNPLQDKILRTIADKHKNIAIIGDDDQSIYRFRGATVSNFLEFPKNYGNCTVKIISHNRRSTPEIVDFSRLIVGKIPSSASTKKDIFTENESFEKICFHEYETNEDEITGIVERIQEMKDKGLINNWSDVAILGFSISSLYPALKLEFDARGIPLVTKGDKSYLEEPITQALIDGILFLTKNEGGIKDFARLKYPLLHTLNPRTNGFLESYSGEEDVIHLKESDLKISSSDDKKRIMGLINFRKETLKSNRSNYSDLVDLVFMLLTSCETIKFLETSSDPTAGITLTQLGKFTSLLSDFSNETGSRAFSKFNEFLTYIMSDSIDTPMNDDVEDAVILQTIHQSKGLEYPVVFMPGLVDNRFPGNRKDDTSFPMESKYYNFWSPNPDVENKDIDFRRLFYVAVTRAEKLVYPSYFKKINRSSKVSRYVDELVKEDGIEVKTEHPSPSISITNTKRNHKDKLKISSSHLQYYLYCPTRYKFNLKHNIEAPHRGYFSFGSSLHSMIEEMTNNVRTNGLKSISKELRDKVFKNNWSMYGFENISAANRQMEHAERYFDNFCSTHVNLMKEIEVSEKKFSLEENNFILTGKIDAIKRKDGNITVIDFKTGKKDKFKIEPESTFVENQANIYLEAIDRLGMKGNSSFELHFLGEKQDKPDAYKMEFDVSNSSRSKILDVLGETADKIIHNDFTPTSEETRLSRCSKCEYRKVCPYKIIEQKKNKAA